MTGSPRPTVSQRGDDRVRGVAYRAPRVGVFNAFHDPGALSAKTFASGVVLVAVHAEKHRSSDVREVREVVVNPRRSVVSEYR